MADEETPSRGPLIAGLLIFAVGVGWWALQGGPDTGEGGVAPATAPSIRADGTSALTAKPATIEVCLLDVEGALEREGQIAVHRQRGAMRSRGPGSREDVIDGCVTLELDAVQHRFDRVDDPLVSRVVALAPGPNPRLELQARREVCVLEVLVDPFPEAGVLGGISGARGGGARWTSTLQSDDPAVPLEIRPLPCGPVSVWAQDQQRQHAPAVWEGTLTEKRTRVTVSLGETCSSRYRVVDARTQEPLPGAFAGSSEADSDGVIEVSGCASGAGAVTLSAEGYRSRLVAVLDATLGQDELVTVALEPGEGHVGTVTLDGEPDGEVRVGGVYGTASLQCEERGAGTWACHAAEDYPVWIWTNCGASPSAGVSAEALLQRPGDSFVLDCTATPDTGIPADEQATVRFQLTRPDGGPLPERGILAVDHYPMAGRGGSLNAVAILKTDATGLSEPLATRAGPVRATSYRDPGNPGETFQALPGENVFELPLESGRAVRCRAFRGLSPPPYRIQMLDVGSGPWEAGLRPGDRLVAVPGIDLATVDAATLVAALDPVVGATASATLQGADGEIYEASWTCEEPPAPGRRPRP